MIAEQGGADGASKENETQGSYCNRSTPWAVPRAALTAHQCSQLAERTSALGSSHGIGKTQPDIVVLFVVCLVFSPTEKEFRAPWIGFIFLLYGDVLTVWEHFIAGGEKWVSAQLSKGKSKKKIYLFLCIILYRGRPSISKWASFLSLPLLSLKNSLWGIWAAFHHSKL